MLDCMSAGDSIAVGVGLVLDCAVHASIGVPSSYLLKADVSGDTCIISAGSNDPENPELYNNLLTARGRMTCRQVIWIIPRHPRAAGIVRMVAAQSGDKYVTFEAGKDGVHPESYMDLANEVRGNAL